MKKKQKKSVVQMKKTVTEKSHFMTVVERLIKEIQTREGNESGVCWDDLRDWIGNHTIADRLKKGLSTSCPAILI